MFNSIDEAKRSVSTLLDSFGHNNEAEDPDALKWLSALRKVFDIAESVDQQNQKLTPKEISEIGDQGLTIIDNLVHKFISNEPDSPIHDLRQSALLIAKWIISHQGRLKTIQSVVDGLAYQANALQDQQTLSKLAEFMGQVARACTADIQHDLENTNPSRPWRILHFNRGIVATRSHDLELMNIVFVELIEALPLDAPEFFKEGMSEMVRLNYPPPVRALMQEFYERIKIPTVH